LHFIDYAGNSDKSNYREREGFMPAFIVYYEKELSTWNQSRKSKGKTRMVLESRPVGPAGRREVERKLEGEFLETFRQRRRNIADIKYRVTRIVAAK
jgi:hypothetical protein